MLRVFAFGFAGAFFPEAFAAGGFEVAFAMGCDVWLPKGKGLFAPQTRVEI